jgi:hypothetical protein
MRLYAKDGMPLRLGTSHTLVTSVAADWAALVEILGTAIALREDKSIRDFALVRSGLDAGTPFAATLGAAYGWIEFRQGVEPKNLRAQPATLPVIDIAALSARDGQFRVSLDAAAANGMRAAIRKLAFLFRSLPGPTLLEAAELDPWIPLLEKPAYQLATKICDLLDKERQTLVSGLETDKAARDELLFYWAMIQTSARLILLASDSAAGSWLAEMAATFEWRRWTPSITLLRERTCWLAACAARSAIAFGPAVIPKYLSVLRRSRQAILTFDALYGMSAIGLSAPDERTSLIRTRTH